MWTTSTFCLYLIFIYFIWLRLPDESCRNCGGGLAENTKCSQCMKPNSMICKKCTLCTVEQFHLICSSQTSEKIYSIPQTHSKDYHLIAAWFIFINLFCSIITAQVLSMMNLDFDPWTRFLLFWGCLPFFWCLYMHQPKVLIESLFLILLGIMIVATLYSFMAMSQLWMILF